jgi:hypothetical protein
MARFLSLVELEGRHCDREIIVLCVGASSSISGTW